MSNKKNTIPFKEWVWYLVAAIFVVWGATQIICGLVLEFASADISDWALKAANDTYTSLFGLSLLHWGLILFSFGVIVGVIDLCVFAGTYDREAEKQTRRAARLGHLNTATTENKEEVKDAEVKQDTPTDD